MPILDQLLQYHAQRKSPLEMLKESRRARMEENLALEQLTMQRESHQAQKDKAAAEAEAEKRAAQSTQKAVQYLQAAVDESGQPDFNKALQVAYAEGDIDTVKTIIAMQKEGSAAQREQMAVNTDMTKEQRAVEDAKRAEEDQVLQRQEAGRAADNFNFEKGLRGIKAAQAQATLENTLREGKKKDLELKEGPEYKAPGAIDNTTLTNILTPVIDEFDVPSDQREALIGHAKIAYERLTSKEFKMSSEKALETIKQSIADTTKGNEGLFVTEGTTNPAEFMSSALGTQPAAPTPTSEQAHMSTAQRALSPEDIARLQQDANNPNSPNREAAIQILQRLQQ